MKGVVYAISYGFAPLDKLRRAQVDKGKRKINQ